MSLVLDNYAQMLKVKNVKLVKTNNNKHTSKYQVGVYIKNKKEFNRVQKVLMNYLLKDANCQKKTSNLSRCKVSQKSDMYAYGQRSGNYNVFHPETFEKPGMYLIRHGTNERVFGSPRISSKKQYIETMNSLGRKSGRKSRRKSGRKSKKVSSSNNKKSKQRGGKAKPKSRWGEDKKVECKVPKNMIRIGHLWTSEKECNERKFVKGGCKEKCIKSIKKKKCFYPGHPKCCVNGPNC